MNKYDYQIQLHEEKLPLEECISFFIMNLIYLFLQLDNIFIIQRVARLMNYLQIHRCREYTLYSILFKQNEFLLLQLQIHKRDINKVYIYQAQIKSSTQLVQNFGEITELVKYLKDNPDIKIENQDYGQELSVLIQIVLKDSAKDGGRDLHRILFKRSKIIDLIERDKVKKQKEISSFEQILLICQNQEQIIQDRELKKIIMKLVGRIQQNTKEIQTKVRCETIQQQALNRVIQKQIFVAIQQQKLKDKLNQLYDQLSSVDLIFKINFMSDELTSHKLLLEQKFRTMRSLILEQRMSKQQLLLEIQLLKQKNNQQSIIIKTLKNQMARLQKQINQAYQFINMKTSFPPIQVEQPLAQNKRQQENFQSFKFSSIFKNQKIRLINNYSIKSTDDSRGKIVLIEPSIKNWIDNTEIKNPSIVLKVTKFSTNILLGVCDINVVKAMKYKVDSWSSSKHGGYYINSGSYVYSSYRTEDNNQKKGFKFYDEQPIRITIEVKKKMITFSSNKKQFSMPYKPDLDLSGLYFGVIMHKDESIVQIIQ